MIKSIVKLRVALIINPDKELHHDLITLLRIELPRVTVVYIRLAAVSVPAAVTVD